ncbi:uncharacterized protein LAESUDRAFT_765148 [Laetiporus sulphureus 93-53]|uniref:Uncharacterized protein n=1 Tax=Laetiporus sulphureus 93-53 TaxID=1314785 RepID=A0A165AXS3_9APHY|nr:uncharacterized protein LAESUDRAFT_765148 [Laetiporus sulphureus 93-53]KZS99860.1 hypothetical protein LAESUDRAFT_765148 [Laetiporus sulphureus 93-53]
MHVIPIHEGDCLKIINYVHNLASVKMKHHPAVCIIENDLMLIECTIMSFKCNANGDAIYDGGWKLWCTQLELLTISKLFNGPEPSIKENISMADDVLI